MARPLSQAFLYVAVTALASLSLEWRIIEAGKLEENWLGGLFLFTPTAIAVLLSFLFGYRGRDLGLRLPGKPQRRAALGWAVGVPTGAILLSFALRLVAGVDELAVTPNIPAGELFTAFFIYFGGAIGEELGWRGFLFARLREAGIPFRGVLTGVLWSAWHWLLIYAGLYASSPKPLFSIAIFTVTVTSYAVFLDWLRARTESVWPVVLCHAVHNYWVLAFAGALLEPKSELHPYLAGESGVILAFLYLCVACYFGLRRYSAR